jgi:hypothetical protein
MFSFYEGPALDRREVFVTFLKPAGLHDLPAHVFFKSQLAANNEPC